MNVPEQTLDKTGYMSMANTGAKTRAKRLSDKEKREVTAEANRKARLQWFAIGGMLFASAVAAIVLVSIFTEGSLPNPYGA